MTMFLSLSFLVGCNTGNSENEDNVDNKIEQDDSEEQPKQYDEDTDTNDFNEDHIRDNEPTEKDEGGSESDMELQKGSNKEFDKNRGAE